ncbi:MAG: phosphoribosylanthranilate isomerase [Fibrobacter sp.]|nr:phosphoribosylanthranilate isomerase [Fibrobacter sp.]
MSTRIKICGITRYEDARTAANLGVDALGFIFFNKSPRYIAPENARDIIKQLPPFVSRVGVFVNAEASTIQEIVRITGIDTIQLHGDESAEFCHNMPLPVIKSFSIRPDFEVSLLDSYNTAGILLDTWHDKLHGGTGKTFDWKIAGKICMKHDNVIIAGGLGPANVEDALRAVTPFGVDINSGVEIMPGIKNPHKIRDIIRIVKSYSYSGSR